MKQSLSARLNVETMKQLEKLGLRVDSMVALAHCLELFPVSGFLDKELAASGFTRKDQDDIEKVEPNTHKIEEHQRKYERLHKEREERKIRERERRRAEAQAAYEKAKKREQSSSSRRAGGMPSGFAGGMPGGFPGGMPGGFPGTMPGGNIDYSKILNDPELMATFKDPEVMVALQDGP
ncbi:hypothetical protein U1Q18_022826 [Sarracenia purpurea var. burkii]